MGALLGRRLVQLVPTLFFVSVLIFGLQQLLPGDPALALAGEEKDPELIAQIRTRYHLDRPVPVQYLLWMRGVLSGDLGQSIRLDLPVSDLIGQKLPVTLQLQYNTDHYGASSADGFALIKSQLEATGLFKVDLQSTEWTQYAKQRVADAYPVFQLGWYADYLDAQDFFQPLYGDNGFIGGHYNDPSLIALINKQATTAGDSARAALSLQIQQKLAAALPIVPLLQISSNVIADKKVGGVKEALATGGLPFGALKSAS